MKFKQRLKNNFSCPEAGYTIIESLVAMIMVSALMAAIAPIIALSVGTRVQARRVELAAQAARSYIDAVRVGQLPAPNVTDNDQEFTASALSGSGCEPINSDDGNLQYCSGITPLGDFYCVDNDGDDKCTPDSLTDMMVYGGFDIETTIDEDGDTTRGYELQVRVFRAAAFASDVRLSQKGVPFTVNNAGLATRDGDAERPLFESRTQIAPTDNSFQNYRDRLE
ncbi:MAG: hormogonium polysaccharide secretion pseudopilin HpsB [Cyanobacteria bacterium P01_H01_bin.35]